MKRGTKKPTGAEQRPHRGGHKELFNNGMAPSVHQDLPQKATESSIKQTEGESKTLLMEGSNPRHKYLDRQDLAVDTAVLKWKKLKTMCTFSNGTNDAET